MRHEVLLERIRRAEPNFTLWRNELHAHPELSGQETETGQWLLGQLASFGIPARRVPGQMAIVAEVCGKKGGPTVALRADMDALPIQEEAGRPHGSAIPGVSHACGHDAHMAIQLGAAFVLHDCRSQWKGVVRLLFEPAEETVGGAQALVDAGTMDGVHAVFALHMHPGLRVGQAQTRVGAMSGASDGVILSIQGQSCHGAYPEKGVDAVILAAQTVCALQTVISRNVSPLDSAVLSFGRVEGGTAGNILAERVTLTGTLRTLRPEVRSRALAMIESIATGVCAAMGGSCAVTFTPGYHPVMCDAHWVARLGDLARAAGIEALDKPTPSLGVDSFGDLTARAPGLYYDLGCANAPDAPPIHTPGFDVDPACLPLGVYLQAALALDALQGVECLGAKHT